MRAQGWAGGSCAQAQHNFCTCCFPGGCRGIFSCDGAADIDCEDNVHGGICDCRPPTETRGLLSRTLGSSMVLQRAPEAAVVWGHVNAGSVVVTLDGKAVGPAARPDGNGTWRR